MGECGCGLEVTRCGLHANDVIAVLSTDQRDLIVSALEDLDHALARRLANVPTEAERNTQ